MKPFLITLLTAGIALGTPEADLRVDVDILRQQLTAAENRIDHLETLTSLLMAAYQLERKVDDYKAEIDRSKINP